MIQTPDNHICEAKRSRPKLVIFDDDPLLLVRFTRQYQELGYEVTPVMVPNSLDSEEDRLFSNGRIVQGDRVELGLYEEPRHKDPVYTVGALLAHAEQTYQYNSTADHKETVDRYAAMHSIERGVKSKTEARALLAEIKPDCVLSDMTMREFSDNRGDAEAQAVDDDTILGTHIMQLAAEIVPQAPRAIHSDGYTQHPHLNPKLLEVRRQDLREARQTAKALGHQVHPKDLPEENSTAHTIHAHFKQAPDTPTLPPR